MKLLLKNGLVYDGTNNPPVKTDVYLEAGVIKQIGDNLTVEATKVIDCTNLVVAPGFIDCHSHNDFFVNHDDVETANLPFLRQGITTQIVGNCGFSSYGVGSDSQYKELIGGGLFKSEHIGSLNDFISKVSGKLMQNIVPLIGHGTTRISVSGNTAKKLSETEMKKQLALVEDALKSGAFGGSLGLMYQPGMFAPTDELEKFAEMIKKYGGILTIHARANSKVAIGYSLLGKAHMIQALDEIIQIMEKTHVRTQYSHLIFVGKSSWKCVKPMLKRFYKARNKGYDIAYDIYPFTYGASVITVILPSWYLKLTKEKRKKPINRWKLKLIINITKRLLGIDYQDLVVSYISDDYPQYEGKTVTELAKSENIKPFDMYLKLVELSLGKGRIMLGKYYNEAIILKLMQDELATFMTDAWYEASGTQNAGTYQAFPYFIQKTRENKLKLEATINKMTGLTANRFKIQNRGYIKVGYAADITIFNYNEIEVNPNIPNEQPKGIKYVIVNGEITIDNNNYTGVKKGIVLRKQINRREELR